MSIWSSWEAIGYEFNDDPSVAERGEVRSYATGFSNHYPTRDGQYEQPANVGICTIPVWCVPGHTEQEEWETTGEWVRLTVAGWEHPFSDGGKPTGRPEVASVVLDEAAARALAADLLAWADGEHAYPQVEAS